MRKSPKIPVPSKRQGIHPKLSPESTSVHSLAYLRFLSRIDSTLNNQPTTGALPLDPNEKALLEMVMLRWAQQATMTVRQTIAHAHLGSPATLHKRLSLLRKKGYLQLEDVEGDKRAKFLVPGPLGFQYLESMGKHMVSAKRNVPQPSTSGAH